MYDKTIAIRLIIIAALCLLGFLFPLSFIVAAWLGWTIYETLKNPPPPPPDEWYTRRWTTTAADPRWRSDFLAFCESPAETEFLEAMIKAHNLTPDKGVLKGSGLTLDLQVSVKPYRLDFLANAWLVVEIDGAAYHSSPEAVARDKQRDKFLRTQGYAVLRIPAKVVFDTPEKAVEKVNLAIASGRISLNAAFTEQTPLTLTKISPRKVQPNKRVISSDVLRTVRFLDSAEGQTKMALMYWNGRDVTQSDSEAVRLWRIAAKKGYAEAQLYLAIAIREGRGSAQSDSEAVHLYRLAADQGNAHAQNQLAFMYREGRGIQQDDTEAARLYQLAVTQGHADAQNNLGNFHLEGRAVEQNNHEAARLFRLASEQGSARAQLNLSLLYSSGCGVEQNYIEAARLCRLSADQGNAIAQNNLATMYRDGRGVPQSDTEAARLFRLAAGQGIGPAQRNLGIMYRDGRGVTQSDTEAAHFFQLASAWAKANPDYVKNNPTFMHQISFAAIESQKKL
ncbi:DUF559 domain-containing protein [Belnapia rosea]|uniref:TPR repeat n=1 Tax=Belnapia rosea TaxID=938405 RepID=A0A1G7BVX7_9PROT|nr:DUF559 domain-containing protein [Belnapia rosea]SDE30720.1 TPR repeat [Belnapia rosea]